MIDLHCHLLPGIDDGPDNLPEALALARQAVDDGVTHAVVTPHIHHGRWDNNLANIHSALDNFSQELQKNSIPLHLKAAAELRVGFEILAMAKAQQLPFLGAWDDKQVILLEMPHSHIPPGVEKIITWLLARNILPMIAHPERNKDVMRNIEKLEPLIDLGCLFQVTAGSVSGQFGERAELRASQLLERGVVTILASDAHHVARRPVNLSAGYKASEKIVGSSLARDLVYTNPRAIASFHFSQL